MIADRKLRGLDEKTILNDADIAGKVHATFKHCGALVRKIDLPMLKEYFAGLTTSDGKPISNSYYRILGKFRDVFERAEEDRLVYANVARKIRRRPNTYAPPAVIMLADFHLVVRTMRANKGKASQAADLVEFMACSGCRVSAPATSCGLISGPKRSWCGSPKAESGTPPVKSQSFLNCSRS